MKHSEGACLVCGKDIVYFTSPKMMECSFCHRKFTAYASCKDGHYICDDCHRSKGVESIIEFCKNTALKDPVKIMQQIMDGPYIYMHGPEHHIMVGAALITAYKNCGGDIDLNDALMQMKDRGSQYPGGSCGLWGCCGAAVSAGMYVSIVTGATPLSVKPWSLANEMTSRALKKISELGGPRCCKRNSFTAAMEAADFTHENLGITMQIPDNIECRYSSENKECKMKSCPYYRDHKSY